MVKEEIKTSDTLEWSKSMFESALAAKSPYFSVDTGKV